MTTPVTVTGDKVAAVLHDPPRWTTRRRARPCWRPLAWRPNATACEPSGQAGKGRPVVPTEAARGRGGGATSASQRGWTMGLVRRWQQSSSLCMTRVPRDRDHALTAALAGAADGLAGVRPEIDAARPRSRRCRLRRAGSRARAAVCRPAGRSSTWWRSTFSPEAASALAVVRLLGKSRERRQTCRRSVDLGQAQACSRCRTAQRAGRRARRRR